MPDYQVGKTDNYDMEIDLHPIDFFAQFLYRLHGKGLDFQNQLGTNLQLILR